MIGDSWAPNLTAAANEPRLAALRKAARQRASGRFWGVLRPAAKGAFSRAPVAASPGEKTIPNYLKVQRLRPSQESPAIGEI
jgi:hypothetical protein